VFDLGLLLTNSLFIPLGFFFFFLLLLLLVVVAAAAAAAAAAAVHYDLLVSALCRPSSGRHQI